MAKPGRYLYLPLSVVMRHLQVPKAGLYSAAFDLFRGHFLADYFHKSLILNGISCIIRPTINLCRRLKMNRKKGLLKREKMRKKQASGAVHATLTAPGTLQSLKNAVRVACTASTVNYCNI